VAVVVAVAGAERKRLNDAGSMATPGQMIGNELADVPAWFEVASRGAL
jgi:hypothetical protein